jgi:yecA family protein
LRTFTQNEPLTAELDRFGDFLDSCKGGGAMNLEELDGFFAAPIAGPETVMPSGYCPEVFGGERAHRFICWATGSA